MTPRPSGAELIARPSAARSRDVPGPDAEPRPDFTGEWFTELVGRAINGIELPDYAGVSDSAAPTGSPLTSPAKP
jgi:hypothetical protein